MSTRFRTHTGEIVTGARLTVAQGKVADAWAENARAVYIENAYASHVTEETKKANLQRGLELAASIRVGLEPIGFTLWQRINNELTGECIAFLP
jgi:hypothetical protein